MIFKQLQQRRFGKIPRLPHAAAFKPASHGVSGFEHVKKQILKGFPGVF
jgi:hypothetical protein